MHRLSPLTQITGPSKAKKNHRAQHPLVHLATPPPVVLRTPAAGAVKEARELLLASAPGPDYDNNSTRKEVGLMTTSSQSSGLLPQQAGRRSPAWRRCQHSPTRSIGPDLPHAVFPGEHGRDGSFFSGKLVGRERGRWRMQRGGEGDEQSSAGHGQRDLDGEPLAR